MMTLISHLPMFENTFANVHNLPPSQLCRSTLLPALSLFKAVDSKENAEYFPINILRQTPNSVATITCPLC
jgi:hypothetical protein